MFVDLIEVKPHFQQYFSHFLAVSFTGRGSFFPKKTTDLGQVTKCMTCESITTFICMVQSQARTHKVMCSGSFNYLPWTTCPPRSTSWWMLYQLITSLHHQLITMGWLSKMKKCIVIYRYNSNISWYVSICTHISFLALHSLS